MMNYTDYSDERLLFLRKNKQSELNDILVELGARNIYWWVK